ncbi:LL-diaminopimelate aminotransferase [Jeotgalibacillus proteolyticus]|uniref:Aminotransferase n=1 Tax=Jeotgalibacillus proteolyticus TaxID=2082395 RepID=A0A2S5G757_9BACL|nr:LL-diaminopimelate aminotransferase [Jeotgalibacillus proteolyticus]PPA68706.1 aspartate aminotransferase [Jeotgalibacillus proteolyticus]PPA68783.1 aspartate aminotransferase [Jeotgalibacillus proteolyticus]
MKSSILSEYNINNLFSDRIGGATFGQENKDYKFGKIKEAKEEALKNNPDKLLIDMGLGEPDWMAESEVIDILYMEAKKSKNRGYSDNGIEDFKFAAAEYLEKEFRLHSKLDPQEEIVHCIGAKSALSLLPYAFINPGDVALVTVPGYPVLATHTSWLRGDVVGLPLKEENEFYPDLDNIDEEVLDRAKLLYINYPNNPTGAPATRKFYETVVKFAKKNNILVISDEAYAPLTANENRLSFLSVPGAKDVGLSLHSLSKAFNMTGWRIGFLAGNKKAIKAFSSVKNNSDSGQFIPIQKAAIHCLRNPEITYRTWKKYDRRHKMLTDVLLGLGFKVRKPQASFYLYVEAPIGTTDGETFNSGEDFSQYLIKKKLISTVPWDDAGNFIRFSVTFEADSEEKEFKVINTLKERLSTDKYIWNEKG